MENRLLTIESATASSRATSGEIIELSKQMSNGKKQKKKGKKKVQPVIQQPESSASESEEEEEHDYEEIKPQFPPNVQHHKRQHHKSNSPRRMKPVQITHNIESSKEEDEDSFRASLLSVYEKSAENTPGDSPRFASIV